jgi:hypothetical protein
MELQHIPAQYFLSETLYPKEHELLWLQKWNACGCPPIADFVEIEGLDRGPTLRSSRADHISLGKK